MTTTAPVRTPALGVLALRDGTYAVASSDSSKPPYLVTPVGASLECGCKAYFFNGDDPKTCKHGDAVRAYLAEQYAEQVRQQPRFCSVCMLNPVVDAFPICAGCMADERERLAARNARIAAQFGWEDAR
jgi:hypothetical protein